MDGGSTRMGIKKEGGKGTGKGSGAREEGRGAWEE